MGFILQQILSGFEIVAIDRVDIREPDGSQKTDLPVGEQLGLFTEAMPGVEIFSNHHSPLRRWSGLCGMYHLQLPQLGWGVSNNQVGIHLARESYAELPE